MAEITVIAPQQEIADLVRELGWKSPEVDVVHARLEHGVAVAREAVARGSKVLVSRSLTHRMITDALPDITGVEIRFSGYDILRAYLQAVGSKGRTAIVGAQDVIDGFCSIENILGLGYETIKITVDDYRYGDGISQALQQGATCIVGHQAVIEEADRRGVQGIVIQSGRESVKLAMSSAQAVLDKLRLRETNARQIDTIINAVDYGILAIDSTGEVTAINSEAHRLLHMNGGAKERKTALISKMLKSIDSHEKHTGMVERVGANTEVVVNYLPIIINGVVGGMVATIQELEQLQAIEKKTRQELVSRGRVAKRTFSDIQSKATGVLRVIADAKRLANYDATLLILGETGVGKEYFAHAIHNANRRKHGPFVTVNCASLPENILESELFGYAEGAFTGAKRGGKVGLFEQAHGGTIFLDEIGEMSEQCQVRLLRVLQEHEVYRLGDDRNIPVDIRVIAATNRDLWGMVQERKFREDLYYRLEVLTIEVPPLRERRVDIEMFVHQFINQYNQQYHTSVSAVSPQGLELLVQYDWPGNIRELQNVVGRLVALAGDTEITADDVCRCLKNRLSEPMARECSLRNAELDVIREALKKTGGNKRKAAEILGIGRATLWRKLKHKED